MTKDKQKDLIIREPKKELSEEQVARKLVLKEEARQLNLKERFKALKDSQMAGLQLNISNPSLYFDQLILAEKNHVKAENLLKELEEKDKECQDNILSANSLESRRIQYKQIDKLLLEALAEQAAGNDIKIKEYLKLREAIKAKYPKK